MDFLGNVGGGTWLLLLILLGVQVFDGFQSASVSAA